MRVFAVDPGISTGWATAVIDVRALKRRGGDVSRLTREGYLDWEAGTDCAMNVDGVRDAAVIDAAVRVNVAGGKVVADPYGMERRDLYAAERASAARLWGRLDTFEADVLVVEDFTVYAGKAGEVSSGGAVPLAPVRVGSMLALAAELAVMDVEYQMASMAKTTVTDERLKRWGFWTKGSDHARDATRHLLTYLRRYAAGEIG